jgi:phospholipid/cholesterol/gamma-HCH transport system permease protein
VAARVSARDGFVAHVGRRSLETARALADVRTWSPLLVGQMRRLGVDSVPIALFIAVFTGIVLALLSSYIFTGTVPLYFVGALVGKTVMMELGPVLTGMALAGRVGASIAAELGTMKVTGQVDALETLAYEPNSYLVVPRVLAAALMFPVVTAFAMAVGVTSGWITAVNLPDLSTPEFLKGLKMFYRFGTSGSGCSRAPASARPSRSWMPGGLDAKSGAGVGESTTRAVVLGCRRSWCSTRSGRRCCCEDGWRKGGRQQESGRRGTCRARHRPPFRPPFRLLHDPARRLTKSFGDRRVRGRDA